MFGKPPSQSPTAGPAIGDAASAGPAGPGARRMIFEEMSSVAAEQMPYSRRRIFSLKEHFAFMPARRMRLSVQRAELSSSKLFRVESTGHQIGLVESEHTTLLLPRRGTIEVRTARSSFVARPGETLLFSPNRRLTTVVPDRSGIYECDVVLIPTASADGERRGRLQPHASELAFAGYPAARQDAALRDYVRYLFSEGARPGSPLANSSLREAAEVLVKELASELIDRLDDGGRMRLRASPQEARLVGLAEEFMRAHLDRPLSVAQVAAQLGVSLRRLQYAFQHVRQASARTIPAELRLERARQQLADPADGRTVAQIALDCGIAHFGRFATAYAARYGELPSVTRQHALRR